MYRRKNIKFKVDVQENENDDEQPFRFTLYLEFKPVCDIVFNNVLKRYIIDPRVGRHEYNSDYYMPRIEKQFKEFINIFDPIILKMEDTGHYESKEYPMFFPIDQRCTSCKGKTKRWYGDWEGPEDHTYLAMCKDCGGTGLRKDQERIKGGK